MIISHANVDAAINCCLAEPEQCRDCPYHGSGERCKKDLLLDAWILLFAKGTESGSGGGGFGSTGPPPPKDGDG